MKSKLSRRNFIQTAAIIGSAPFTCTTGTFANDEKNDRPNVGCIGMGGMGMGDAKDHANYADIVAVCDVDAKHLAAAKSHEQVGQGKADAYANYRRVLDRNDIEVVSIVTPDHWHIKIAIEALQAGKHVFCQKPLTLTLEENQLIRDACKKYSNQVFFVGTQQRSDRSRFLRAVNMVQRGMLGDIKHVTVGINGAPTGGPFPVQPVPQALDWDMWLGQAPKVDYRQQRCHNAFRWWYEYSGGKFTDWGAHHVDIAQWALNENGAGQGPIEVDGTDSQHPVEFNDGYPLVDDSYNTSHDFAIQCKFASGVQMEINSRSDNGILFEGSKGRIFVNRQRITGKPIDEDWDAGAYGSCELQQLYKDKQHEWHKANFYRCIREGGLPVSDVYSHVQAMNTCHLAAISARLRRKINWDPIAEQIIGDEQAAAFFARTPRSGFEIPRV